MFFSALACSKTDGYTDRHMYICTWLFKWWWFKIQYILCILFLGSVILKTWGKYKYIVSKPINFKATKQAMRGISQGIMDTTLDNRTQSVDASDATLWHCIMLRSWERQNAPWTKRIQRQVCDSPVENWAKKRHTASDRLVHSHSLHPPTCVPVIFASEGFTNEICYLPTSYSTSHWWTSTYIHTWHVAS